MASPWRDSAEKWASLLSQDCVQILISTCIPDTLPTRRSFWLDQCGLLWWSESQRFVCRFLFALCKWSSDLFVQIYSWEEEKCQQLFRYPASSKGQSTATYWVGQVRPQWLLAPQWHCWEQLTFTRERCWEFFHFKWLNKIQNSKLWGLQKRLFQSVPQRRCSDLYLDIFRYPGVVLHTWIQGWRVIRFWDSRVFRDFSDALMVPNFPHLI